MDINTVSYTPKYPVQTLSKALDIITYLKNNPSVEGVSISELSEALEMGKSVVHRMLDTLLAYNYVEKSYNGSSYRLGWGLFYAGNAVPEQHTLNSGIYLPILEKLCNEFFETVNMGIRNNYDVVIISKVEPNVRIRASVQIGGREPLHSTSIGKLFMSELSNEEIIQYFNNQNVQKYTKNTIITADQMLSELSIIKKQGYSTDNEELYEGLICSGVPIRDFSGKIVSAISISGPAERMTKEKRKKILAALKLASKQISEFMGYNPLEVTSH